MTRWRRRGGFTLLECLLAIAIVSGVLIALLQLRAESLRDRVELAETQRADREAEALFQMFVTGAVETPEVDRSRGAVSWEGEYLGHPFRAVRTLREVPNPVRAGGGDGGGDASSQGLRATVPMYAYTLTYRGRVHEFDWIR